MRVAYKRGSEILAEYWLEIIKGDLMFKTEVVTLYTILNIENSTYCVMCRVKQNSCYFRK